MRKRMRPNSAPDDADDEEHEDDGDDEGGDDDDVDVEDDDDVDVEDDEDEDNDMLPSMMEVLSLRDEVRTLQVQAAMRVAALAEFLDGHSLVPLPTGVVVRETSGLGKLFAGFCNN